MNRFTTEELMRAEPTVVHLTSRKDIKFVPALFLNGGGSDDEPIMLEDEHGEIIQLDSEPDALDLAEEMLYDMEENA